MSAVRSLLPLIAIAVAGCSSPTPPPAPNPSVLVTTLSPTRGTLPETVVAYGNAAPALTGSQTVSVAQPGQVTRLSVTPGASVQAGQPLLTFATAPASRNTYQQALAALTTARAQRDTTAQLLKQQLATRDQLSQADKAVEDATNALAALQADGAGLAEKTLSAPFEGVVTVVSVAQGDRTQAGAPLLTIARTSQLVVTVGVSPRDLARMHIGQPASLVRLTGGAAIEGHVVRVDNALNARTRLVDVDLTFPPGSLLLGEAMKASIVVSQLGGWVVPHRTVVTANGPPHVFQVDAGKAKAVPVVISLSSPDADVIQGNLDPAEPLILAGAYQVSNGEAVRSGR